MYTRAVANHGPCAKYIALCGAFLIAGGFLRGLSRRRTRSKSLLHHAQTSMDILRRLSGTAADLNRVP